MLELASLCPLQLPKRMSLLQCLRVNRDKCMHRIYDHIWCDRMCRLSSTFQAKRKTNKKRGLLIGSDTEGCREHKVAYSLRFAALLLAMDLATIWFRTFLSGDSRRSISTDYSGHSSDGSDRQHAKSFQGVVAIHFKQVKCRLLKLLVSWKGWTSEWRGTRVAGSTWNSWNQGWYIPGMSWEATSNTYKGITVSQPLQPVLLPGVDRPLVVRWNRARRGSTSGEICSQYWCSQHYWMVFNFKHQLFSSSFQQMVGGCPSLGPVTGIPFTIAISQGACFPMGPVMGSDSPVVLWFLLGAFWGIQTSPNWSERRDLEDSGSIASCRGVFGKWVERPILPEKSRYDHVILAVVLSMARQEEVKRSRMLAEALGNIILIDTKWNTSKWYKMQIHTNAVAVFLQYCTAMCNARALELV